MSFLKHFSLTGQPQLSAKAKDPCHNVLQLTHWSQSYNKCVGFQKTITDPSVEIHSSREM